MADPMYFEPPVDAYVFPEGGGPIRLPDGSIDPTSSFRPDGFRYSWQSPDRVLPQAQLQPVTMTRDLPPPSTQAYRTPLQPEYGGSHMYREGPSDYYRRSSEVGVPVLRSEERARQSRYKYPSNETTREYGTADNRAAQEYDVNYQYAMDRLDKARAEAGLGPAPRNMYQDDFVNAQRMGTQSRRFRDPEGVDAFGRPSVTPPAKMPASAGRAIRKVLQDRESGASPSDGFKEYAFKNYQEEPLLKVFKNYPEIPPVPPRVSQFEAEYQRVADEAAFPRRDDRMIQEGLYPEDPPGLYQNLGQELPAVGPLFAFDPYQGY